jgi:hypothetical protein
MLGLKALWIAAKGVMTRILVSFTYYRARKKIDE